MRPNSRPPHAPRSRTISLSASPRTSPSSVSPLRSLSRKLSSRSGRRLRDSLEDFGWLSPTIELPSLLPHSPGSPESSIDVPITPTTPALLSLAAFSASPLPVGTQPPTYRRPTRPLPCTPPRCGNGYDMGAETPTASPWSTPVGRSAIPEQTPRARPQPLLSRGPGPREAALVETLVRASGHPQIACAALEEYAWHCLLSGTRVREYCAAASAAVDKSSYRGLRHTLCQSPTRLLYPYALFSDSTFPAPLPPHFQGTLTRRQLVDALLYIADDRSQAWVLELVLEYIGRRWRYESGNIVDAIAKNLADVELQIMQCNPLNDAVSILQSIRSALGFVTSSALVDSLNARSTDAIPVVKAWAVRRLNAGMEPHAIAVELSRTRERVGLPLRDAITRVLMSLCLDGRTSIIMEADRPRTRTLSRISLGAKRRTLIPQWLSPRHSGVAKIQGEHRRPSLPLMLSHNSTTPVRVRTPSADRDTPSPCSTPSSTSSRQSPLTRTSPPPSSPLTTNSLGLTNTEIDSRDSLVDHLLVLRYRHGQDADAWFLGSGRERAIAFLDRIEATSPQLRETISQLREAFELVERTPTTATLHVRDASFDLEQYLADISHVDSDESTAPETPPSQASGHSRQWSIASADTLHSSITEVSVASGNRLSIVSKFSICEATRAVPVTLASYQFPLKPEGPKSATEAVHEVPDFTVPDYPRFAQSLPNVKDAYTRLPERSVRRRRSPPVISPLLPAFDLATNTVAPGLTKLPSTAFPGLAPPSPTPRCAPPSSQASERDFTKRKQYRRCVIVDGAHLSPGQSPRGTDDLTALGIVLDLCARVPSAAEVERRLLDAVRAEARRTAARGDKFDAEARARVAWLLEQVGHELAHPDLVAAVQRVLMHISTPASSPRRTKATHLTIRIPPREKPNLKIITSPASPDFSVSTSPSCYTPSSASPNNVDPRTFSFPPQRTPSPSGLRRRTALRHAGTGTGTVTHTDPRSSLPSLPAAASSPLFLTPNHVSMPAAVSTELESTRSLSPHAPSVVHAL